MYRKIENCRDTLITKPIAEECKANGLVYDMTDLYNSFSAFLALDIELEDQVLPRLVPRPHQEACMRHVTYRFKQGSTKFLIGHVARSGKTYTSAMVIYEDSLTRRKGNYLIITTCPTETKQQWLDVFKYSQFKNFKVHDVSDGIGDLGIHNVYICSIQYLKLHLQDNIQLPVCNPGS